MLKRAIKWSSVALAVLAMFFFARYASRTLQGHDLTSLVEGPGVWGMALLVSLYTASIATTSAAWRWQLAAVHQPVTYRWATTVLAVTQFGKYLPGNVGHHIGRIGLSVKAGIRSSAAVLTIGYELLLAIVAAAHLCAVGLLLWPPASLAGQPWLEHRWLWLILVSVGATAALFVVPRLAAMLASMRVGEQIGTGRFSLSFPAIAGSYAMYVVGQFAIGVGLWILSGTLSPPDTTIPPALFFTGAFATGWIAGLLVPGAPAGLGVREIVLSAWFAEVLPQDVAVLLVLATRFATIAGDAINFCWGTWTFSRTQKQVV